MEVFQDVVIVRRHPKTVKVDPFTLLLQINGYPMLPANNSLLASQIFISYFSGVYYNEGRSTRCLRNAIARIGADKSVHTTQTCINLISIHLQF